MRSALATCGILVSASKRCIHIRVRCTGGALSVGLHHHTNNGIRMYSHVSSGRGANDKSVKGLENPPLAAGRENGALPFLRR